MTGGPSLVSGAILYPSTGDNGRTASASPVVPLDTPGLPEAPRSPDVPTPPPPEALKSPEVSTLKPPEGLGKPPEVSKPVEETQDEAVRRLLEQEEERRRLRKSRRGRLRELEEARSELAQKELVLMEKQAELLEKEQTLLVLREEVSADEVFVPITHIPPIQLGKIL